MFQQRAVSLLFVALWVMVSAASAQPQRFFGGIGDVDALTFTDDEKLLLATGYLVVEYDLETHAITMIHHPWQERALHGMWAIPGGAAVDMLDSQVRLKWWNRADGTVVTGPELNPSGGSTHPYNRLSWSPIVETSQDGSLLAILLEVTWPVDFSELRIYDAATLELLDVTPLEGRFVKIKPVFSEDSHTVYTAVVGSDYFGDQSNPSLLERDIAADTVKFSRDLFPSKYLLGIANGRDGLRFLWGRHVAQKCNPLYGPCGIAQTGSLRSIAWERAVRLPSQRDAVLQSGSGSDLFCQGGCPEPVSFEGGTPSFSPCGSYVVQEPGLQEVDTGTVVREDIEWGSQFSRDEAFVAYLSYKPWSYGSRIVTVTTKDGEARDEVPVHPDSSIQRIAAVTKNRTVLRLGEHDISRYSMEDGQETQSLSFIERRADKMIVSPNESLVVYGVEWSSGSVNLTAGSTDDLNARAVFLSTGTPNDLCFNPANDRLLVIGYGLNEYAINPVDYAASPLVRTYDPQLTGLVIYKCAAYSPDGAVLLAARGNGVPQLHRYDAVEGSLLSTMPLANQWDDIEFDPTGAVLLVTENGTRSIYDAQTLEKRYTLTGPIHAAAFALDGGLLITAGDDAIKLWRTASGEFLGSTPVISELWVHSIVPSPPEDIVYIADGQRVLEWRLPLRSALEHPEELQLDVILKREHTITPVDRNDDGVYDAADVLLEARRAGP